MANPEGTPIWYELLTNDAAASVKFYEEVVGWKVTAPLPGGMEYRQIDTGHGFVGGMMELSEPMRRNGAKPTWLLYIGVDDVDASTKIAEKEGAKVLLEPFDIPNVGRLAMLADPQGIPFYVMRGASDESSTAFERTGMGKCNWNELATPDQVAGNAFYAKVFGWNYPDKMEMPGGAGDYVFIAVGESRIGATMKRTSEQPPGWMFYFRVPNIDAAVERVKKAGGKVHAGPMDVPGNDRVIVASDVHGVPFGLAAPAVPPN